MKCSWWFPLFSLCVAVAGCKTANPAVCCLDPADCNAVGIPEDMRGCAMGLACVDNACVVPSCSMQGCMPGAPVCNIATDVCEGCTDSTSCSQFPDQGLCDTASGSCVECVVSTDCAGTTPFCDANACRACKLDVECASGACGDDGACIAESQIVYLDPGGTDAGTCPSASPCRGIPYAVSQTTGQRNHLVMRTGSYSAPFGLRINAVDTPATLLIFHGSNSSLVDATNGDGPLFFSEVPTTMRDLELESQSGTGLVVGGPSLFERVKIRASGRGAVVSGSTTFRDVEIAEFQGIGGEGMLLSPSSTVVLERVIIRGWDTAISSPASGAVEISNLLAFGSRLVAIDLPSATGNISFSTVADAGTDSGAGPRAVACGGGLTIRSSIIWAPGTTTRLPVSGCNLVSSIAGPTAVAGVSSSDPLFVNAVAGDYHLKAGSPARDAVDSGPTTDFEGDARPRGMRWDIGADEAAP